MGVPGSVLLVSILILHHHPSQLYALQNYPTLAEICPAQTFCHSNATKELMTGHESCCQGCTCADDCYVMGNCCPDANLPQDPPDATSCEQVANLINPGRKTTSLGATVQNFYYRLISTCPEAEDSTRNINSRQLCYRPRILKERIPVSTLDGGKLFRNEYCARCNGETEFEYWDMYAIKCPALWEVEFTGIQDRDLFVRDNCELMAKPSKYLYIQKTYCPQAYPSHMIDSCNVTKQWDLYDADLERACEAQTPNVHSVYRDDQSSSYMKTMYANIYCYFCNIRANDRAVQHECKHVTLDLPTGYRLIQHVRLNRHDEYNVEETEPRCPGGGQFYDKYADVCRPFYCGYGMMPHLDSCQPIGDGWDLAFYVIFKVVDIGPWDKDWFTEWLDLVANMLIRTFNEELASGKLLNCTVQPCVTRLRLSDTGDFYFNVDFAVVEQCPVHKMTAAMYQILNRYVLFGFENGTLALNISELDETEIENWTSIGSVMERQQCYGDLRVNRQLVEPCRRIRLNVSELEDENVSNNVISSLIDAQISPGNESFIICISQYEAIMERALLLETMSKTNTAKALPSTASTLNCRLWQVLTGVLGLYKSLK